MVRAGQGTETRGHAGEWSGQDRAQKRGVMQGDGQGRTGHRNEGSCVHYTLHAYNHCTSIAHLPRGRR